MLVRLNAVALIKFAVGARFIQGPRILYRVIVALVRDVSLPRIFSLQEEIRFCASPELVISQLCMEAMDPNEAIIIKVCVALSNLTVVLFDRTDQTIDRSIDWLIDSRR